MENNIKQIIKKFGLTANKIIPLRAVYLIDSQDGLYCMKKIDYKKDKLLFIYGAKNHLIKRGFSNIDRYRVIHQKPFVQYNDAVYIMTKYIIGRECDFYNPIEVKQAAENLARFHRASEGYKAPKGSKKKSDMGKWIKIYLKRCEDLIYMKNLVKMKSQKNQIDTLFLRNVDEYYNMGISAVQMLEKNGYFEQVEEENKKRSFCHHDYTYHNIIVDHQKKQHIIDFDYCKYELTCYDLAQFIMRNMRKCYWDFNRAMELVENYNEIKMVSDRELKLMGSLFQFPQRFWRIASRYYYEKYDWSEDLFIEELEKIIEHKPFKIDFLEAYYKKNL